MFYCERCKRLTEKETCPVCKKARHIRPPKEDDAVLLCTIRHLLASMIEPLLQEEKIPYAKTPLESSTVLFGSTLLTNYSFYTPYEVYARAQELLEGVFSEDEEIRRALREARS